MTQKGENKRFLVGKGFAEVTATEVSLLVDLCEDTDSIDKEEANTELKVALEELARTDVTDAGYAFVKLICSPPAMHTKHTSE